MKNKYLLSLVISSFLSVVFGMLGGLAAKDSQREFLDVYYLRTPICAVLQPESFEKKVEEEKYSTIVNSISYRGDPMSKAPIVIGESLDFSGEINKTKVDYLNSSFEANIFAAVRNESFDEEYHCPLKAAFLLPEKEHKLAKNEIYLSEHLAKEVVSSSGLENIDCIIGKTIKVGSNDLKVINIIVSLEGMTDLFENYIFVNRSYFSDKNTEVFIFFPRFLYSAFALVDEIWKINNSGSTSTVLFLRYLKQDFAFSKAVTPYNEKENNVTVLFLAGLSFCAPFVAFWMLFLRKEIFKFNKDVFFIASLSGFGSQALLLMTHSLLFLGPLTPCGVACCFCYSLGSIIAVTAFKKYFFKGDSISA